LKGKTAVLRGAARCLGLAFAQVLAEAGANIAVLDIIEPSEGLFQIRKDHGIKVEYYKTNVTSRDEVMSRSRRSKRSLGR
jgi:sorbose reductase